MRFGLFVPQGWRLDLAGINPAEHWATMLGIAKAAEDGPFDSIWVYDHFHTVPVPTQEATHEAWTLMAAYAAATSRVKLGQMCTCMAYRNPAYLAKVAATVDVISGGRAEMGIGAGWYEHEWRAYGYGFPGAGERLAMLDEGVQIMRQLWTTGTATLDGKHYQVDGAICQPLPLQDGGIPLWIAAAAKKTLRIAAQYAAYTNFTGPPTVPAQVRSPRSALPRSRHGLRDDRPSANYNVIIGETETGRYRPAGVEPRAPGEVHARRRGRQPGPDLADGPLVGTPDQIAERLSQISRLGMTYAIINLPDVAYDRSGLTLFHGKGRPRLLLTSRVPGETVK